MILLKNAIFFVTGFEDQPEKCSKLSLEEKRQLVHGIAQCLEDAPAVLSSFTRRELLEIICAEMGKERKYSGFTKSKMIEHLLKLVTKKCNEATSEKELDSSQTQDENTSNRQQKNKYLCQLPKESEHVPSEIVREDPKLLLCENLACRAALDSEDSFCKRCSCCICCQYDDNKDPSLWLTCENGSLDEGVPCGISCHLKCALEQGKSGKLKKNSHVKVDQCFSCVSCGKLNDLMRSWRKQLLVASEARRVDVLCLRLSLSHKILIGTDIYKELLKIVESAVATLENEVGSLDWASATMDRSIVNRLCCGTAVQKLCASAVEAFDSMSTSYSFDRVNDKDSPACKIHFEELSPTRVTIILDYDERLLKDLYSCSLWHRRSKGDYLEEPTYVVSRPTKRFELYNLDPSSEYFCRVSICSKSRTIGTWEGNWETPAISVKEQIEREYAITYAQMRTESMNSSDSKVASSDHQPSMMKQDLENKSDGSPPLLPLQKKHIILPSVASPPTNAPPTPCKSDGTKGVNNLAGKKQLKESDYEYSVRVIRKLEHEGYLEADFRVKFLTWFSLKATTQERRVVSVFIDTFLDDPPSLAGQLLDTFMDQICCEQKLLASSRGFCTRLWH